MTAAERNQAALQNMAAREFADVMLGIVCACDLCSWWLKRIMGREV